MLDLETLNLKKCLSLHLRIIKHLYIVIKYVAPFKPVIVFMHVHMYVAM